MNLRLYPRCTPFPVVPSSPKEPVPLGTSGTPSRESLGMPGFGLGRWGVTVPQLFSSQAPVSSATKVSMARAMPARPWTASTTPSALSAAPVVSVPGTLPPPQPPLGQTLMQRSTCQGPQLSLSLSERWLATCLSLPGLGQLCPSAPLLFLRTSLSPVPPVGPASGSSPTSSLVRFGLGQQSCLGRR